MKFNQIELQMLPGDAIVLYSDGVSEAFNSRDECYGDERLLAGLAKSTDSPAGVVTSSLLQSVRAFADGTPQSDDIAVLTMRIAGNTTPSAP
jgi:sigma-B regulation protein RsbU (phosphoserine phosphatase)